MLSGHGPDIGSLSAFAMRPPYQRSTHNHTNSPHWVIKLGVRAHTSSKRRRVTIMRITRIETFLVPPRWLFCRVETDDGVVGWGEPVVEGRAEVVRARRRRPGRTPRRPGPAARSRTTGRSSPRAASTGAAPSSPARSPASTRPCGTSPGKAYGAPVHALLGGPVRDRVRVYAWVGGDEPAELTEQIAAQVEAGFTAVKMNAAGRTSADPHPRRDSPRSSTASPPPARHSARTATSPSTSTAGSPPRAPAASRRTRPAAPAVRRGTRRCRSSGHLLAGLVAASHPARHR